MTAIMTRSFLAGPNIDPDLAYVIMDHRGRRVVTWTEINKERREKQRKHLNDIRHVPVMRLTRLWVGFNPHFFFGGWFASLDNLHHSECVWRRTPLMMERLMDLFPITFRYGDLDEDFQMWCEEFSKAFPRGRYGGKKRGYAVVRWDGFREISRREAVHK